MGFRMTAFLPSLGVSLFGLGALAWLMLTAPQQGADGGARSGQIGVILPPWQAAGLHGAAAFDLPIVALRWGGHLAVLDTSARPEARAMLHDLGYITINTAVPVSCTAAEMRDA